MKAVITVTGHDNIGIIARVSTECAKYGANILDISQSVMRDYFAMIMLADIDALTIPFSVLSIPWPPSGGAMGWISTPCTRKFSTPCTVSEAQERTIQLC